MKVTITKIFDKEAQGKNGVYTRRAIKTKEYGEQWLSGFKNKGNEYWKEGDVVEIEIEKYNKDGKEYLNFKPLSRLDLMEKRIIALEIAVARMGNNQHTKMDTIEYPQDDINPDDIPF